MNAAPQSTPRSQAGQERGRGSTDAAGGVELEPLCATVWPRLVRLLTLKTGDRAIAEEVSQDALLRLALEIRAGRTPDNIGAWLIRVAMNLATSVGRRSQVARRHAYQLDPQPTRSPEDLAIDRERFASMHRAFAELRPRDRHILLLSARGHSGLEIANRTGITHGAVRTRLHRLRTRLQARLAQLEAA